ncbi:cytochrome c-type biogenesis protein [Phenylobacterium sp.]|uniref:cytochrome c-type biogenesis protein n=1 Tax=Phenylobacterium sp. TaxID=1871053 RepID=UPI001215AB3A|nr:cytochrome c-type biogenesis protein [Phenylobacterium sp.]THD61362.1 MAG: cytochrome c-type biogenesis protein CcmH [Phenylobacterium sp.]
MRRLTLAAAAALALAAPAFAVTPDEQLRDPKLEARARALSQELRCLVCQNQSIDDSTAPLAHDLRVILRERLAAGDSDRQAVDYLVARYGDFVLLKPPFQPDTWALWLGPLAVLLAGGAGAAIYLRARARAGEAPLSAAEEAEAARLMATQDKLD